MIYLNVCKNIVVLDKLQNPDYLNFVGLYLCKYEEVTVLDPVESFASQKKFKSQKVLRHLYTETDDKIYFSRGLLFIIPDTEYEIVSQIPDSINIENLDTNNIKKTLPSFDLRDDQVIAVRKCLFNKRGIIQMPTATGKSAVITSIVKQLQKVKPNIKCLALAPTLSTADNLNNTFIKNDINTHIYGHPDTNIIEGTNVALAQTLVSDAPLNPNLLYDVDAVFYDECLPQSAKILLSDFTIIDMLHLYEDDSINSVMSFNLETNTYEPKSILRKIKTEYNQKFCRIRYKNPADEREYSIALTENHKVYTQEHGFIPVSELSLDDHLRFDDKIMRNTNFIKYMYCDILDIHHGTGSKAKYKYNIEVEDNHNYFADGILVSNCHHLKCDTWNSLNMMLKNAEYSLGFSALSIDDDEIKLDNVQDLSYESAKIIGSTGKVLLSVKPSYYIEKGIIATPVFFRIKNEINLPGNINGYDWQKAVKYGIKSKERTALISKTAEIFNRYNYKILILISEKDYGFKLAKDLVKHGVYNFGISYGGNKGYVYKSSRPINKQGPVEYDVQYTNKKSLDVISDFNSNKIFVLIGTSHIDEGIDIENLDAVILVGSGKKDRRIIQRVGRALRKTKTGKYAYIVDFTDSGNNILAKHSLDRLEVYKDIIGVSDDYIYTVSFTNVEQIFKSLENID